MGAFAEMVKARAFAIPSRTRAPVPTEAASLQQLDRMVAPFFNVHREVRGEYLDRRPGRENKSPRIDRILVPNAKLSAAGWTSIIGVEGKKPGTKLGPHVCQGIDYTWATFVVDGRSVYPEAIFLWPVLNESGIDGEQIIGAIESVMYQNRIGVTHVNDYTKNIRFQMGPVLLELRGERIVRMDHDRLLKIGRKVGSR